MKNILIKTWLLLSICFCSFQLSAVAKEIQVKPGDEVSSSKCEALCITVWKKPKELDGKKHYKVIFTEIFKGTYKEIQQECKWSGEAVMDSESYLVHRYEPYEIYTTDSYYPSASLPEKYFNNPLLVTEESCSN